MNPQLSSMLHLWATLRAAHHLFWTLHWQSRGPNFYGDHQLFERLYKARLEEIDDLAELIAGHFGSDKLDPLKAWSAAQEVISAMVQAGTPVAIVDTVLAAVETANDACMEGKYPAGTTNLISGIGTNHLTAKYLLQQRYVAAPAKL